METLVLPSCGIFPKEKPKWNRVHTPKTLLSQTHTEHFLGAAGAFHNGRMCMEVPTVVEYRRADSGLTIEERKAI